MTPLIPLTTREPRAGAPGPDASPPALTGQAAAWQVQSLLLSYPGEQLPEHARLARRVAAELPRDIADGLHRFLDHLDDPNNPNAPNDRERSDGRDGRERAGRRDDRDRHADARPPNRPGDAQGPQRSEYAQPRPQTAPGRLAEEYVATFDHRKRCCPFLTYYAYGDTRKRGLALLRLKQAYAAAGWQLTDEELPDHLAVVLEFAAAEPETGHRLLQEHRAGLELLRLALRDADSPWAHLLDSVSATLPPLGGDEREAVVRLAAEGPPEEEVGLDPFAPPQFTPGTSDSVGGRR